MSRMFPEFPPEWHDYGRCRLLDGRYNFVAAIIGFKSSDQSICASRFNGRSKVL